MYNLPQLFFSDRSEMSSLQFIIIILPFAKRKNGAHCIEQCVLMSGILTHWTDTYYSCTQKVEIYISKICYLICI